MLFQVGIATMFAAVNVLQNGATYVNKWITNSISFCNLLNQTKTTNCK